MACIHQVHKRKLQILYIIIINIILLLLIIYFSDNLEFKKKTYYEK